MSSGCVAYNSFALTTARRVFAAQLNRVTPAQNEPTVATMSTPDPESPGQFAGNLADTTVTSDKFKIVGWTKNLVEGSLAFGCCLLIIGLLLSLLGFFTVTWASGNVFAIGLGEFIRGVGGNVFAAGLALMLFSGFRRLAARVDWIGRFMGTKGGR
jgi:hypothetical protein